MSHSARGVEALCEAVRAHLRVYSAGERGESERVRGRRASGDRGRTTQASESRPLRKGTEQAQTII